MAIALTLAQAAGQAFDNLQVHWLANNLQTVLDQFWRQTIDTFPDGQPNGRPVANWLTIVAALADQMPALDVPLEQLTLAAEYVYRLCWMADFLQGNNNISTGQATFLLARYNAIIGF
jgi:hypothetical protein